MINLMKNVETQIQNTIANDYFSFAPLGFTKPGEEWINILPRKRGRKIILQTDIRFNRWESNPHLTTGMIEETNKAVLCKSDFFF